MKAMIDSFIRGGLTDLLTPIPFVLFGVPIALAIYAGFLYLRRNSDSYRAIWTLSLPILAIICVVITVSVTSDTPSVTAETPRSHRSTIHAGVPSFPDDLPSALLSLVAFLGICFFRSLVLSAFPLIILVGFTPPKDTRRTIQVAVGTISLAFVMILGTAIQSEGRQRREQLRKDQLQKIEELEKERFGW